MTEIQGNEGRSGANARTAKDRDCVAIHHGGRRIGLYRIKQVGETGMLLNHGAISFPWGRCLMWKFATPARSNPFLF
jgi:hypothetical protein